MLFSPVLRAGELAAAQAQVAAEFDSLVAALERHGIETLVAADTETPPKPDAIFPEQLGELSS